MAVPTESAKLVNAWCEQRTPPEVRDRARLETEVSGNRITIFDCTVGGDGADWLRVPSAQLRYDPYTGV